MLIVKIGGGSSINIKGIVADLSELNEKFIVIHGANSIRDRLAEQLGRPKKTITSVSGYSSVFSDEHAIELIMMSYSGLQNKRIVEMFQQHGINAVGLSGLDGKSIQGLRNKGIRIEENGRQKIVRDFSGKPKRANKELLQLLLDNGYVPVLCIPIIDENNFAINSENDDIVNVINEAFHADTILSLIEAPGFLENKDDENSLVRNIPKEELQEREQQVEGRMKRKILALRKLFEAGAAKVIISDGRTKNPVKDALSGRGTTIQ